jgi:hypothetical protein
VRLISTEAPRKDPGFDYRSEEEPQNSSNEDEFSPQEVLDGVYSARPATDALHQHFRNRFNLKVKQAATEARSVVGFNDKTVRHYRIVF